MYERIPGTSFHSLKVIYLFRFDILSFVNGDLHSSLLCKFLRKTEKCGFIDLVQFYGEKLECDSTLIVTHRAVKEF